MLGTGGGMTDVQVTGVVKLCHSLQIGPTLLAVVVSIQLLSLSPSGKDHNTLLARANIWNTCTDNGWFNTASAATFLGCSTWLAGDKYQR